MLSDTWDAIVAALKHPVVRPDGGLLCNISTIQYLGLQEDEHGCKHVHTALTLPKNEVMCI